jgi:FSR family fosmidomycin resistance protein-like MFS transporter
MVTDIYMPVITAILPLLISTYGFSYFLAGLLVTSYNLTSSVTQPFFGWLSDRYGRQLNISVSLLISAVFIALMGVVTSYPLLILCAGLAAIGHACFHPNALSIVNRLAEGGNRGRITSFFVVGGNIGYAIGPLLAGALVVSFGLNGLVLLIFPAIFMAAGLKKMLPSGLESFAVKEKEPETAGKNPFSRAIIVLFAASTLRAWAIFSAIAFFPPFLIARGYDIFTANLLVTLMLLCGVAGQIAGGVISDSYGRKEFVIAGLLLSIPAFMVFLFSSGMLSVIALLIFGFFLWSSFAVTVAMSHELMPTRVGLTSGLMIGVSIGAGGVGVAFSGYLADQYSLTTALGTVPVLILIAVFIMLTLGYPWKSLQQLLRA